MSVAAGPNETVPQRNGSGMSHIEHRNMGNSK